MRVARKNDSVRIVDRHLEPARAEIVRIVVETAPPLRDDTLWITSAGENPPRGRGPRTPWRPGAGGSLHPEPHLAAFDFRVWNILEPAEFAIGEDGKPYWRTEAPRWATRCTVCAATRHGSGVYDFLYEESLYTIRSGPRAGERVVVGHLHGEFDQAKKEGRG